MVDWNSLKEKALDVTKAGVDMAVEATKTGIENRQESNKELKLRFGNYIIRRRQDGLHYIGGYSKEPARLLEFAGYQFEGSTIEEKHITKGKTKQKGRAGSALAGGLIGSAFSPFGMVAGATIGASRKKKGKIDTQTKVIREEKPGRAVLSMRDVHTGDVLTLKAKLTAVESGNVDRFFN